MSSTAANCANITGNQRFKRGINEDPELQITKDEFENIREALEKEEFRKLFFDYLQEIQDPENRKIYEEEIKQFEKERGIEVTFIHPQPGFVIKSSINGKCKCFINIAKCTEIAPPKHEIAHNPKTDSRCLSWSIPLAQAPSRDDMDARGQRCKVYDVVFHPDALYLAQRNSEFRKCLIDTAVDAVEREFHVELDHTNLKFPKLAYKGIAQPTVIRKLSADATAEQREPHPLDHVSPPKPSPDSDKPKLLHPKTHAPAKPAFATPKYVIKHSQDIDLLEYTNELDAKFNVTVPRFLIVEIDLPLLKSSAECQLDVTAKSIYLVSERVGAKYQLNVQLPYEVDDKAGNARFDLDHRRLCITLPVIRNSSNQGHDNHDMQRIFNREDSGIESCWSDKSHIEEENKEDKIDDNKEGQTDKVLVQTNAFDTPQTSFLKNSILYQFPKKFDCNVIDNVMSFVLHVRNVQPDSICILHQSNTVHLKFASLGTGCYPTYFAFFIKLPDKGSKLKIETAEAEAWENNIVLNLNLNETSDKIEYYHAGLNEYEPEKYKVYNKFSFNELNANKNIDNCKEATIVDVGKKSTAKQLKATAVKLIGNIDDNEGYNEDQEDVITLDTELGRKKQNKKQRKRNRPHRSLSESACDEFKAILRQPQWQPSKTIENSPPQHNKLVSSAMMLMSQRKCRSFSECHDNNGFSASVSKGILKHYSRYGPRPSISDSCSSIDDCNSTSSYSRSMDAGANSFSHSFGDIPEDSEPGLSESCKKTVRFNDHIMKQVFRLDSSILGQRKKNQKRRDRKLRAQQRRLSEGDSADYEDENDHTPAKSVQYLKNTNNETGASLEPEQHDSGIDFSIAVTNDKEIVQHEQFSAKKNQKNDPLLDSDTEFSTNAMIFDMDDDI